MHNDLLGEEMWDRQHPEGSLSRGPDPDKVAHHLAGGEITDADRKRNLGAALRKCGKIDKPAVKAALRDAHFENIAEVLTFAPTHPRFSKIERWAADFIADHREPKAAPDPAETLTAPKHKDGFTSESPIRAFSDFQVDGLYAIGKGFRPSLRHLSTYLTAMHEKEGWIFCQVVLPVDDASDPTIFFRKATYADVPPKPLVITSTMGEIKSADPALAAYFAKGKLEFAPLLDQDDPINPKHYAGTACAEIIEQMPTNVGLAGKYVWRLGEKDEETQECGKAAWYLKRQIALHETRRGAVFGFSIMSDAAEYRRMSNVHINAALHAGKLTNWRATAMSALVSYTITGQVSFLETVIGFLEGSECGLGMGRGLEP